MRKSYKNSIFADSCVCASPCTLNFAKYKEHFRFKWISYRDFGLAWILLPTEMRLHL